MTTEAHLFPDHLPATEGAEISWPAVYEAAEGVIDRCRGVDLDMWEEDELKTLYNCLSLEIAKRTEDANEPRH